MSHPISIITSSTPQARAASIRGFTLLEILIALAILAIAFAAIITVATNQANHVGYLRDKTLAHWVALNQLTEIQVSNKWLPTGKQQGDEEMGLHKWHWRRVVTKTPDDRVRQVEIAVFRERGDDESITRLVSFISQPM